MGTIPLNFGNNSQTSNPIFTPFIGTGPFNFAPFGGQNPSGNNGLPLAGAWASGGFNTSGTPSTSGWNSFYNPTTPFSTGTSSNTLFGLPQNTFPAFGSSSTPGGAVPFTGTVPGSHNTTYGFNPNTGLPTIGDPGIGVTSATQGPFPQIQTNELKKIYGNAVGGALSQFLNSGAGYNPQVVQALINQALPLEAKGNARLMQDFGNVGNAYSSTAATGIGDFEAQFNANLTGEMAQLYEQSVQNYIAVLESTLGPASHSRAEALTPLSIFSQLGGAASTGLSTAKSQGGLAGIFAGIGAL